MSKDNSPKRMKTGANDTLLKKAVRNSFCIKRLKKLKGQVRSLIMELNTVVNEKENISLQPAGQQGLHSLETLGEKEEVLRHDIMQLMHAKHVLKIFNGDQQP